MFDDMRTADWRLSYGLTIGNCSISSAAADGHLGAVDQAALGLRRDDVTLAQAARDFHLRADGFPRRDDLFFGLVSLDDIHAAGAGDRFDRGRRDEERRRGLRLLDRGGGEETGLQASVRVRGDRFHRERALV